MPGKATAVVGMRRAGKTTFLQQLRAGRIASGVPKEQLPYISFEDERLAGIDGARLHLLLEEHHRRLSSPSNAGAGAASPDAGRQALTTWHFDEIHVVPGWEEFVRRILDAGNAEVVVSGSSSEMLSGEAATPLRDRVWQVPIHPFSFAEALKRQGLPAPAVGEPLTHPERGRLERAFLEWLGTGGLPGAQGLDRAARRQLLRDCVDVTMLRDVVERHQVRNVAALRWLVRRLLGNAARGFSIQKFYAALKAEGVAVAKDTLHELLSHLEECFLVRVVEMASPSERQRMVNPRKAYPADTGLIPVFDRTGKLSLGRALKTAVLAELERRRFQVSYVRTPEDHELDFLARNPCGGAELIQVCPDMTDPDIAWRHFRAHNAARRQFPYARRRTLTLTRDGLPHAAPPDMDVRPAYEWMLDGE